MKLNCIRYSKSNCSKQNPVDCYEPVQCEGANQRCMSVGYINQTTNKHEISLSDCFEQCNHSYNSSHCIANEKLEQNEAYICCCSTDYCNKHFIIIPNVNNNKKNDKQQSTKPTTVADARKVSSNPIQAESTTVNLTNSPLFVPLLASSIVLMLVIIIFIVVFKFRKSIFKRRHMNTTNGGGGNGNGVIIRNGNVNGNGNLNVMMGTDDTVLPLIGNNGDLSTSSNIKSDDIHLIEKISLGPLSTVYKGTFANNQTQTKLLCAVKIFSNAEKAAASQLWKNEKDIYSYLSNSEYMTKFIAALERVNDLNTNEYWLLTEYQQNGSLYDYLKRTKLNWQLTCNFALSILEGLAYLHTESTGINNKTKPSIAHRDLKSKNILVKSNGTCCITDFGLAVALKSSKLTSIDVRSQVGTKRYMSPELLEGAIQFTKETLVRIDVYSCALVLWEVISRGDFYSVDNDVYELPYESDVGKDPSIDDMQRLVVVQKRRPSIRPEWQQHEGVKKIIQTIEECWDTDVAARITSQCATARLRKFISITPLSDINNV